MPTSDRDLDAEVAEHPEYEDPAYWLAMGLKCIFCGETEGIDTPITPENGLGVCESCVARIVMERLAAATRPAAEAEA